jgi:hypothetical protein
MNLDIMRLGASSTPLLNDFDGDDSAADTDTEDTDNIKLPSNKPRMYRAAFSGVAVSPTGFWVVFQVAPDQYWPVQVTAVAASAVTTTVTSTDHPPTAIVTSPEALTLLQLLAGVDMAGAILPPDILARIIIGVCDNEYDIDEYDDNDNSKRTIRDLVRRSSNWPDTKQVSVDTAFLELPDWWQSRILLPICTLDEIHYQESGSSVGGGGGGGGGAWEYQCQVQDVGSHTVTPTCKVLEKVAWSDPATAITADDEDSEDVPCSEQAAFFALALALRYKAPIRLSLAPSNSDALLLSHDQVLVQFPLYRSRDKLQETPATVTANIERGFEIHKLQRALQIAIQKRDLSAAAKIRNVLDEMDSLQDLPVQAETDTQNMQ